MLGHPLKGSAPPGGALTDCLPQSERLDPSFDAHGEHLGHRRLEYVPGAVMDQLSHCATTDGADIVGLVSNCVQHRLTAVEHVLVAADPDC